MHCSAIENTGLNSVWYCVENYIANARASGYFAKNRRQQNKKWLHRSIEQQLLEQFYQHMEIKKLLPYFEEKVLKEEASPFNAAEALLKEYYGNR